MRPGITLHWSGHTLHWSGSHYICLFLLKIICCLHGSDSTCFCDTRCNLEHLVLVQVRFYLATSTPLTRSLASQESISMSEKIRKVSSYSSWYCLLLAISSLADEDLDSSWIPKNRSKKCPIVPLWCTSAAATNPSTLVLESTTSFKVKYRTDKAFALASRLVVFLAFVPLEHIEPAFEA